MKDHFVESALEAFDANKAVGPKEEMVALTIWVPKSAKEQYDQIQSRTGSKFSAVLRDILVYCIGKKAH